MHGTRVICRSFWTIQSVTIVFNVRKKRLLTLRFFSHFRNFRTSCGSAVFSPLTNFFHFQVFRQFLRSNAVFDRKRSNSITRLAHRKSDVQSRSRRWNLSMKEKRGGFETPMTLNDIRVGDCGTSIRKKSQRSKQDESVAGSRHLRARDFNRESRG